jgi:serine/threonine protein phosphatase 1
MIFMSARIIAIGDIHGCSAAFMALLEKVDPCAGDTIVQLGDAVDRGPDTRGVIDELIALSKICRVVLLLGDHEEMLLDAIGDADRLPRWLRNGGAETIRSYGRDPSKAIPVANSFIPASHLDFLGNAKAYLETGDHIFVHAGYIPELPMLDQPPLALRWRVCDRDTKPHYSGKTVIAGHSAQRSGNILDLGFIKCIDTNCVRGGWLTALEITSGTIWQANLAGHARRL